MERQMEKDTEAGICWPNMQMPVGMFSGCAGLKGLHAK